jgi:hypothetical protein
VTYDKIETNSDFFITRKQGDKLSFTAVNVTKIFYEGNPLFVQKPTFFGMAFDGSQDVEGIGKARYWRDTVNLK